MVPVVNIINDVLLLSSSLVYELFTFSILLFKKCFGSISLCLIDKVFCISIFVSAKSLSNSFSFFSNAMYFPYNRYLQSV